MAVENPKTPLIPSPGFMPEGSVHVADPARELLEKRVDRFWVCFCVAYFTEAVGTLVARTYMPLSEREFYMIEGAILCVHIVVGSIIHHLSEKAQQCLFGVESQEYLEDPVVGVV